jgi:hypothetical protein
LRRLEELSPEEVDRVRKILLSVPYYKREEMREWLWEQNLRSLAKRLHTLSILSETKVYLFWSRDWMEVAR